MTARFSLVTFALCGAAALGGCGSNLPESNTPPPAPAATVVTPAPGSTVITQAPPSGTTTVPPGTVPPGTVPPGTVVVVPGSGTSAPPPRLSASELDALIRGNTASGTTSSGQAYYMRFDRSGHVAYHEGTSYSSTGAWRVTPDGQLCTRFSTINAGAEDCYTVYRNASGTYTYDSPDGHPVGSFAVSPG